MELVFSESDADEELLLVPESNCSSSKITRVTKLYIMFLFVWQRLFRLSDTGLVVLLTFLATFLQLVSSTLDLSKLAAFLKQLPRNIYQARKYVGRNKDAFTKYVSCPKCHYVYDMEVCRKAMPDGSFQSSLCTSVKYPNHPQSALRHRMCNTELMKSVKTSSGTVVLYPYQIYCYRSVVEALQTLLEKPNFFRACELWRNRKVSGETLSDVYDGRIWSEFMNPMDQPFLSLPFNFALALNVDWFEPFKRSIYACGAMYITILNLPREQRYLLENTILVGVIPGPKEPKKTMNSYLTPLVRELKELWSGIQMSTNSGNSVLVRAALFCLACDIPASRKVSGFLSHSAYHGCSRCLKTFPTSTFGEKADLIAVNGHLELMLHTGFMPTSTKNVKQKKTKKK